MNAKVIEPEPQPRRVQITMDEGDADLLLDIAANFGGVGPHRNVLGTLSRALRDAGVYRSGTHSDEGYGYYLSLAGRRPKQLVK